MTIFFGIAVIACITGIFTRIWGRRFEEVLPLSMFSVIFVIYITGIFGSLNIGFWAVVILGGIAGLGCLFLAIKEKAEFLKEVITPGSIAFLILAIIFWWTNEGRVLQQWDDFSHWGLVVKNMHFFQQLGNIPESTVKFTDYPPAASIFSYFFTNFGSYSETNAIRGMGILTACTMLPVFRNIRWEEKRTLPCGILLLLLVYILPTSLHKNAYIGLYVDSFLGILFFFLIYLIVTYECGLFRTVNLAAGCAMLTLTKASGAGLAAMAICLLAANLLVMRKDKRLCKFILADIAISVLSMFFANQSWSLYLRFSGTQRAWSASELSIRGIVDIFTGEAPAYRLQTIKNYGAFLLKEPMGGWLVKFPTAFWLLLFVTFSVLFIKLCKKNDRKYYSVIFGGLITGFVVYVAFLLVLYLFSYSEFEALRLASAKRYLSTYILGLLCSYIILFISYFRKKALMVHILALAILSLCITKDGAFDVLLYPRESILVSQKLEQGYYGAARFQNKLNYTTDRVYVISQNNNGLDYWKLRNVFTPVKINDNYTWSIGEKYGTDDALTAYKSIYSWSEDLKDFDYVYLFRVDDSFIEQFGELFENPEDIRNDTMFTVTHEEDGDQLAHLILNEEMTSY